MTFGELVFRLMQERGLNQNTLAAKSGLSRHHINRIVHNKVDFPSVENAFLLADALEVDINVFRACLNDSKNRRKASGGSLKSETGEKGADG